MPPNLIYFFAIMAVGTFSFGLYLELFQNGDLQAHPYLTNTLSGVTGFSASALVIAVVFNWVVRRHRSSTWDVAMRDAGEEFAERTFQVFEATPSALVLRPDFSDVLYEVFERNVMLTSVTYDYYLRKIDHARHAVDDARTRQELQLFSRKLERLLGNSYANVVHAFDLAEGQLAWAGKIQCDIALGAIVDRLELSKQVSFDELYSLVIRALMNVAILINWMKYSVDAKRFLRVGGVRRGRYEGIRRRQSY